MNRRVFKRKMYQKMLEWKHSEQGGTALLIEGARRVGKSTLVNQFASKEYKTAIIIDFNLASEEVIGLFDNLMDLNFIFFQLQRIYHVQLFDRQSVIVFDEVQRCPKARQAIKYLVADGRYDYIETGSLISIHLNTKDITIPSEERRLEMLPMDYEEFCWALGKDVTYSLLRTAFENCYPSVGAHRDSMRDLRLYMLIGGMPQAVDAYLTTNNLQVVDNIKRDILNLYAEDLIKIDKSQQLSRLFMAIPAQLSKNSSRYAPTSVIEGITFDKVQELLHDLADSKTINIAYHANDPNVGFSLNADYKRFKIYLSDTGLFVTLVFGDKNFTENVIYQKLLSDKLDANLGYIYENLVAQMLRATGSKLFYYTFPKDNRHNYEIDFLLSRGNKICPIEVKSSRYHSHTSLDVFCDKFSNRVGQRYIIHTNDLEKDGQILCLPIYMTEFI